MAVEFEWDEKKAAANLARHGLSFEEAQTVFRDPLARIVDDQIHSTAERRELIIGNTLPGRFVFVCFTQRAPQRVRLISARPGTKKERRKYEDYIL